MIAPCDCTYRNPPARFVRGLLALLATPFLLLAMLVIGFWLTTSGKLAAALVSGEGDRPVSTSPDRLSNDGCPGRLPPVYLRTFAVLSEERRND